MPAGNDEVGQSPQHTVKRKPGRPPGSAKGKSASKATDNKTPEGVVKSKPGRPLGSTNRAKSAAKAHDKLPLPLARLNDNPASPSTVPPVAAAARLTGTKPPASSGRGRGRPPGSLNKRVLAMVASGEAGGSSSPAIAATLAQTPGSLLAHKTKSPARAKTKGRSAPVAHSTMKVAAGGVIKKASKAIVSAAKSSAVKPTAKGASPKKKAAGSGTDRKKTPARRSPVPRGGEDEGDHMLEPAGPASSSPAMEPTFNPGPASAGPASARLPAGASTNLRSTARAPPAAGIVPIVLSPFKAVWTLLTGTANPGSSSGGA